MDGITRDGTTTYWLGRPLIWLRDGAMHFDAELWSKARRISLGVARVEIARLVQELCPGATIEESEE